MLSLGLRRGSRLLCLLRSLHLVDNANDLRLTVRELREHLRFVGALAQQAIAAGRMEVRALYILTPTLLLDGVHLCRQSLYAIHSSAHQVFPDSLLEGSLAHYLRGTLLGNVRALFWHWEAVSLRDLTVHVAFFPDFRVVPADSILLAFPPPAALVRFGGQGAVLLHPQCTTQAAGILGLGALALLPPGDRGFLFFLEHACFDLGLCATALLPFGYGGLLVLWSVEGVGGRCLAIAPHPTRPPH